MNVNGLLETSEKYLDLVATGLSQSTGVKVTAGKSWTTNVKTKELEFDKNSLSKLPFLAVKGVLLHEIGHLKYTENPRITEIQKKYPIMQSVYNGFEDYRIENKLENQYGEFASESLGYNETLAIADNFGGDLSKAPDIEKFVLLSLSLAFSHTSRLADKEQSRIWNYFREYGGGGDQDLFRGADEVRDRIIKNYRKILDIFTECGRAGTVNDLKKIVDEKLVPIIQDYLDNPENQKQKGEGEGDGKGKGKEMEKSFAGKRVELGGEQKNSEQKMEAHGKLAGNSRRPDFTELEVKALIEPYIATLENRLRDILKEKDSVRWTGNHKGGRLLSRNAFKVCLGDNRIFSKKQNPDTPKYKFHLLLDSSGSMYEKGKATNTFIGGCLISEVAKRLRFPVDVYKFEYDIVKLAEVEEYRKFSGGGTDDLTALTTLEKNINAEDDNLIFVFTDGYSDGDISPIVNKITEKNSVLVGVGFGQEASAEIAVRYPQFVILNKPEEMLTEVISKLRTLISR